MFLTFKLKTDKPTYFLQRHYRGAVLTGKPHVLVHLTG